MILLFITTYPKEIQSMAIGFGITGKLVGERTPSKILKVFFFVLPANDIDLKQHDGR